MRLGIVFGAAGLGVIACALALIPLALGQKHLDVMPVFQGSTSVYAVPFRGGAPREVMRLHGQWAFPVAAPDGTSLYLEKAPALARTEVWRVPLDGAAPTHLANTTVFTRLAWSPDLTRFAILDPNAVVIHRLGGTRLLSIGAGNIVPSWNGDYLADEAETRPPSTGWRLDLHVWRSDGKKMWSKRMPFPAASVSVAADGRSVAAVRMHRLELVTPQRTRLLASDASGWTPQWTPDGRSLLYYDDGGRLVVRNVVTGVARTLVAGGRRFTDAALSADGRTVYFLRLNEAVSIPK